MSETAYRGGTAVATTSYDAFASYGASANMDGTFLSFSRNGEWEYGADKEELSRGTRLVANIPGLRVGWRCWVAKKCIDDRTNLLSDRIPSCRRDALGDLDKGLWERDKEGRPLDPWVMSNVLQLADSESGETYIYTTSSKGGDGAIKRLCAEYAKEGRMRPGQLPVIELQRDSYIHKEWGKTYVPELPIVKWVDDGAAPGGGYEPESGGVTRTHLREIDDDSDIPF